MISPTIFSGTPNSQTFENIFQHFSGYCGQTDITMIIGVLMQLYVTKRPETEARQTRSSGKN
jgi:hypothetical protein